MFARQCGTGGGNAFAHMPSGFTVAFPQTAQAIQPGQIGILSGALRVTQRDAVARRNATRIAPPQRMFGTVNGTWRAFGIQYGVIEATGMLTRGKASGDVRYENRKRPI